MRRSWAIVYWVLLLAPALALGAGAFRLLRREQARMDTAVEEARAARARTLGATVEAAVLDAESEVADALAALDAGGRPDALRQLEREHPLVRAVFAWRREPGLLLPRTDGPLTRAESEFVRRFAPLFSGTEPWPAAKMRGRSPVSATATRTSSPACASCVIRSSL